MSSGREASARIRAEDELLFQLARGLGRGRFSLGEAAAKFAALDGPSAFGFSSRDGHARENLSRTGRWVDESSRLARRLAKLPRIRAALLEGRLLEERSLEERSDVRRTVRCAGRWTVALG